jgi:hypothetical protein
MRWPKKGRVDYVVIDEAATFDKASIAELLKLPLEERALRCLELGMRSVPVARDEQVEIEVELTSRAQPGLVVYEDRPVRAPMTHEALAELAKPHEPREGEVTADHVAAWLKEKH